MSFILHATHNVTSINKSSVLTKEYMTKTIGFGKLANLGDVHFNTPVGSC